MITNLPGREQANEKLHHHLLYEELMKETILRSPDIFNEDGMSIEGCGQYVGLHVLAGPVYSVDSLNKKT